jgi:hypothetical protein
MKHYFISWMVHADLLRYLRPDHIFFFNEKNRGEREYIWPETKAGSCLLIWPFRLQGAVWQRAKSNLSDTPAHAPTGSMALGSTRLCPMHYGRQHKLYPKLLAE